VAVLLLERIHPDAAELLQRAGFEVIAHEGAAEGAALAGRASGAAVVGIRSGSRIDGAALDRLPGLLAIGCFCVGTAQVDLEAAAARGVPVFNSPFSNTRSVAELVIAEIIALRRRLFDRSSELHAGRWRKTAAGAREVRRGTLGIIGYGHIGAQVSVLAESMGMRVLFYDVAPRLPLGGAEPVPSLSELLARSDVVTLHIPETPRPLIGAAEIALMKPGAALINNARGGVVDVKALAAAVREGRLGGAAVDVFPVEPAASESAFESELRQLPNVILTPHIGGSTEEAQAAIAEDVAGKLIRYIRHGGTVGAVNVPQVDLPERVVRPGAEGEPAGEPAELPHRILHFHRNRPGVLSAIHKAIADLGANISGEYLQTDARLGYVVLDVDRADTDALVPRLCEAPETLRVRLVR
jgi:D-3-phosphoglycerate dehydrogenase